jgi:hypothetical protein
VHYQGTEVFCYSYKNAADSPTALGFNVDGGCRHENNGDFSPSQVSTPVTVPPKNVGPSGQVILRYYKLDRGLIGTFGGITSCNDLNEKPMAKVAEQFIAAHPNQSCERQDYGTDRILIACRAYMKDIPARLQELETICKEVKGSK